MSQYENHLPPEGINVSRENPLLDFGQMLLVVIAGVAIVVALLAALSSVLVRYIPFSVEEAIAEYATELLPESAPLTEQQQQTRDYIQRLVDEMRADVGLQPDMPVTVHFQQGEMVNAFAAVGGNLVFFQGLIDALDSENALAFVVAHELAHLKERHPIQAMGRGVVIATVLATMVGASDSSIAQLVVNTTGQLTAFSFNRDMEMDADNIALEALYKRYGHVAGADKLFEVLLEKSGEVPVWLSTHPSSEQRIDNITQHVRNGELTPLPDFIANKKEN